MRPLIAHGTATGLPVERLEADLRLDGRAHGGAASVTARFRVIGDIARILVPPPGAGQRRDELWRHTCFEFFVRGGSGPAYVEVNAAPSRDWAVYAFTDYRAGRRAPAIIEPPRIDVAASPARLELVARMPIAALLPAPPGAIAAALSAVIEERDGRLSYWALAHPDAVRPDFHHSGSFAHEIRH